MIRALLGLGDLVTNVNLENMGQMTNAPLHAVVETNAHFSSGTIRPLQAGALRERLYREQVNDVPRRNALQIPWVAAEKVSGQIQIPLVACRSI